MRRTLRYSISITCLLMVAGSVQSQQPSLYRVKRMSFNDPIFSEMSPVIIRDGIIFCSDRRFSAVKDRKSFEGRRVYNLYKAMRKDSTEYGKPVMIRGERSGLFNIGPLCFAPDGKSVWFTSEVETGRAAKKRGYKNHSGIFRAELNGDELVSLSAFPYNSTEYNIAQPSLSSDGKYLYFASDMPGGEGKSDIWVSELVDGQWSRPVNPGPGINSTGRESFPFIHPSGRLYFSSDRDGGYGKLDVYYTTLSDGVWADPVLLPEPLNSPENDFAIVAADDMQSGFFSSDRRINDDIYSFTSTIIRKSVCDTLIENNYCYELVEENAVKHDSIPFRYEWHFGDGSKGTGPSVIYCYPGPGTYMIRLDVVNLITGEILYNEKTFSLEITDIEQPYISAADTASAGRNIFFSAEKTNLPGWNIAEYYWNFGDETVAGGMKVSKSYLKPGTYNVQLIVRTEPGEAGIIREACICRNITIVPGEL
ncbi:MAG TPA: PKD domain-containing protein [Bacteroidales bacterium]|nr:PKD domain-containing protein [Bacteroidales bacterium]HQJ82263.1 PKD domain-containing protein [Bacteroidales bacterium]